MTRLKILRRTERENKCGKMVALLVEENCIYFEVMAPWLVVGCVSFHYNGFGLSISPGRLKRPNVTTNQGNWERRRRLTLNDFPISGSPQNDILAVLAPPCDTRRGIAGGPTSEHCIFLLLHGNIRR